MSVTTSGGVVRVALANYIANAVVKRIIVEFGPSDVYTIHSENKIILPAPGVGKIIKIMPAVHILEFGTVAYVATGTPVLDFYYGSDRSFDAGLPTSGSFMTGTQSKISSVVELSGGLTNVNLSDIENKALTVRTASDATFWTVGDGTYRAIVTYMIIDI